MATLQELKSVVKETLESRGILGQIKARMRAEVFNALDDQSEPQPPLSNENMVINELIRDYLEFNKYKYTASVLQAESGMSPSPLDREFLAQELNIAEDRDSTSVPLLYGLVSHFLSGNKARSRPAQGGQPPHRTRPLDEDAPLTSQDLYTECLGNRSKLKFSDLGLYENTSSWGRFLSGSG